MGIDGIGRPGPGGLGAPGGVGGPGGPKRVSGDTFRIDAEATVERAGGSDALERVHRGELSIDEYLDGRVDEAVQHLVGRLPAEQLDFVRQTLREQLSSDPVLVELVRRTVSTTPTE